MKTPHTSSADNREGSALVVVMGVAAILIIALTSMSFNSANKALRTRRLRDGAKALSVAEAGIGDFIAKMSTNYTYWINKTNTASFADGSYLVVSEQLTNGSVKLSSVAVVNNVERTTVLELFGDPDAWKDIVIDGVGILNGGTAVLDGNDIVVGSCHSNDDIDFTKGAVSGNVTSAGTLTIAGGTIDPSPPYLGLDSDDGIGPVPIPGPDFDKYRDAAIAGGLYYATDKHFSGTISPANGIIYVNGNASCANNTTINGCIVANGNIVIDNRLTQNQIVPRMPALMAKGDIETNNRNVYHGSIYCDGDFTSPNNRQVYGSVIAQGTVHIANRFHLELEDGPPLWDPDTNDVPTVQIGAWME